MRAIQSLIAALAAARINVVVADQLANARQQRNRHTCAPPPPPEPEPIDIHEIPLPPALGNTTDGACTLNINPRGTGCIAQAGLSSGDFLRDGHHVIASANFVGAPSAPDPASIYTGVQVILLKADNSTFSNGDSWKCLTCGVPDSNRHGVAGLQAEYPQTFPDGTRALTGTTVIDCGSAQLASDDCMPSKVSLYPIRLSNKADDDGSESGLPIRELRIHPDGVHLTFNSFAVTGTGLGEIGLFGRLQFNATSLQYDLINVTLLSTPDLVRPITTTGKRMAFNRSAITVGELRGLTGTGREITYVGYPYESCNIDVFAADLATGAVRRITEHPEYVDPIAVSPDDQWQVILDTRGSGRLMFVAGLRSVPPITDLITISAVSSIRNNGNRRFFAPYLLDRDGDRGDYFGQKLNAGGDTWPGSIDDPNWNAGADPRWSMDGTRIVYYEWLALPPACGGANPLPCEVSLYPDGRAERVMVATLTSREPLPLQSVPEAPDIIPWGVEYVPGMSIVAPQPEVPPGEYILDGTSSGYASVSVIWNEGKTAIQTVAVVYHNYSDDGLSVISGYENVTMTPRNETLAHYDWYSNITSTGALTGTKITSPEGFHLDIDALWNFFDANGTLTTIVDGEAYYQPCNYC